MKSYYIQGKVIQNEGNQEVIKKELSANWAINDWVFLITSIDSVLCYKIFSSPNIFGNKAWRHSILTL